MVSIAKVEMALKVYVLLCVTMSSWGNFELSLEVVWTENLRINLLVPENYLRETGNVADVSLL